MMAEVEERIVAVLKADGTVSALTTRVQPWIRFQGTGLPAITYARISSSPYNHATGATTTWECRMQVDCWASTYSGAKALAAAARGALSGYSESGETPNIVMAHLMSETDMEEPPESGEGASDIYRVMQEYFLNFTE